ncbi:acetylglutamate kinase [Gracilibacillus marinus]|uniref:Acetylglutamate kinase n=1 Tax=Gracilibacillus marinus TaxID=630535 RepID=A0ABV8VRF1_9BACI
MENNYVVIKCGGSVFEQLPHSFYQDIVTIQEQGEWYPIIVHGGGPLISKLLDQTGVQSTFVDGLRVTTEEVLDVVEMALSGAMNKGIVRNIAQLGGKGLGISGVDTQLLTAEPVDPTGKLGYVGKVTEVNKDILEQMASQGLIPIISPIAMDNYGQRYNVNADMAASSIAESLHAKLCFISDIDGIYEEVNGEKHVFHQLNEQEITTLIERKVISGGMIPKVNAAIQALKHHVREVSIVNGMEQNGLLQFMQGKMIGTRINLDKEVKSI